MGISKYSNDFKSVCIENKVPDLVHQIKKDIYLNNDSEKLLNFFECLSRDNYLDCSNRLLESKYRKYIRAREHIAHIINNGGSVFITLTFTDEVLKKTNASTRRKYVARYLKEQCSSYVANIDFSPEKHREHYHGLVSNRVDMSKWQYGFVFVEQVRVHDFDMKRIARYITKLTSHAFKVNSTRLIYSRSVV